MRSSRPLRHDARGRIQEILAAAGPDRRSHGHERRSHAGGVGLARTTRVRTHRPSVQGEESATRRGIADAGTVFPAGPAGKAAAALLALLWAGTGCASDPGATGPGGAGDGDSYADASAPSPRDGDATLADTSIPQRSPDAAGAPEGAAPSDASAADGEAPDSGTPPADDASDDGPATLDGGSDAQGPRFNILAIGQLTAADRSEDIHAPFVRAATAWLTTLAADKNFTFTSVENPNSITDDVLTGYNLVLQLNYTPFGWNTTAQAAFEKYLTDGRGGWVGVHHAALYGPEVQPSSEPPWTWFYDFIGQINFLDYIATFASANVYVEEPTHPIFAGVPSPFVVTTDEWYKWDRSPRPNVHVLGHVDESSYMPPSDIKMGGDHPVIWTNDAYKGRNLYIFMGHHPNLFQNIAYMTLLQNSIFWAAGQ